MPKISESWPIARRFYRCTSCGGPIEKGERYHRWTGTNDLWEGLATARECGECCDRYGRPFPPAERSESRV